MDRSRWLTLAGTLLFAAVAVAWMLPPTTPLSHPSQPIVGRSGVGRRQPQAVPPQIEGAPAMPRADWRNLGPVAPGYGNDEREALPSDRARAQETADSEETDASFLSGYQWAERNDVADPADCRIWRDTPQERGCLAYLVDRDRSIESSTDQPDAGADAWPEEDQPPRSPSLGPDDAIRPSSV